MTFQVERRVEFCETDMAGIVHFSNFFRYMEYAEVAYLRSRGLSVKIVWEGVLLGFPRVAAKCDYVKPAKFEDVLQIEGTIERVGAKSVTYGFEFKRGGEVLARGSTTSVCCRLGANDEWEGTPIPDSYRAVLLGV